MLKTTEDYVFNFTQILIPAIQKITFLYFERLQIASLQLSHTEYIDTVIKFSLSVIK